MNKKMIYSIVFGLSVTIILYIIPSILLGLEINWVIYTFGFYNYYDKYYLNLSDLSMIHKIYVFGIYTSIWLIFGFGFYYFSDKIKNLLIRINLISPKSENVSTKSENVSDTILSHKYSVLLKYKVLVYILMVIDTIYSFKTLFGGGLDDKVISYVVIAYIISMFSLYCLILMIHFLFDLDRDKTNK